MDRGLYLKLDDVSGRRVGLLLTETVGRRAAIYSVAVLRWGFARVTLEDDNSAMLIGEWLPPVRRTRTKRPR